MRPVLRFFLFFTLLILTFSCTTDTTTTSPDTGVPEDSGNTDSADIEADSTDATQTTDPVTGDIEEDGTTSPDTAGPEPITYTLEFGPITVEPYVENTQCVITRLGNVEELYVTMIENYVGDVSHHFIVYKVNDEEKQNEPFECFPFLDTLDPDAGLPLMITQKAEDSLELPEGVAFKLDENQMVRLELHYINLQPEPVEFSTTTHITGYTDGSTLEEANFLFIGTPDVSLPPGQESTLGPITFQPPDILDNANFFGITGHTHQWGTNVEINLLDGSGEGGPVYDVTDWDWDEPETVYHDPPFQVAPGGAFEFTCEYYNGSSSHVYFGEGYNDEMCFFWAYYYPSEGYYICIHTEEYGGYDVCCPSDDFVCGLIPFFF